MWNERMRKEGKPDCLIVVHKEGRTLNAILCAGCKVLGGALGLARAIGSCYRTSRAMVKSGNVQRKN